MSEQRLKKRFDDQTSWTTGTMLAVSISILPIAGRLGSILTLRAVGVLV